MYSAGQEVIKINKNSPQRVTEKISGGSFKNPTQHSPLHYTGRDLCSGHITLRDIANLATPGCYIETEWGHLPINNRGWKCWGDVSCCLRGSGDLQQSVCCPCLCFTALMCVTWIQHNYAFYWIPLFQLSRLYLSACGFFRGLFPLSFQLSFPPSFFFFTFSVSSSLCLYLMSSLIPSAPFLLKQIPQAWKSPRAQLKILLFSTVGK